MAQLSYAEGSVSLQPAGTTSWTDAALNRPVTIGDKLWSDRDSRAELDIGDAVVRLGGNTGFSFLNLDDQTAQMQVTAGTVIVHVRTLASGEQDEIDTPNLALTLEQPGTYRVEVSDTGDTTIVKVDDGAAQASGGGETFPVAAQQSVTFTGTSVLTADYAMLGSPDSLDGWSMRRDQEDRQQEAVAQQYVSPAGGRGERPRLLRHLGGHVGLWLCLVPGCRRGLGALQPGVLGVGLALGLDLGRSGAVGLRAVSLRALGLLAPALVLDPGAAPPATDLRAGPGRMGRGGAPHMSRGGSGAMWAGSLSVRTMSTFPAITRVRRTSATSTWQTPGLRTRRSAMRTEDMRATSGMATVRSREP